MGNNNLHEIMRVEHCKVGNLKCNNYRLFGCSKWAVRSYGSQSNHFHYGAVSQQLCLALEIDN